MSFADIGRTSTREGKINMTLGAFLNKRRLELGLSGEFVANKLDVHKTTYFNWENGKYKKIAYKYIEPLCTVLKIPPLTLLRWDANEEKDVLDLPSYDWTAWAGSGYNQLIEGHGFEYIKFDNLPENADFAVRIKGGTMLPSYEAGDIAFVKTDVMIAFGDVGIFILNDESYLRQWGNGKLLSLNPIYKPVNVDEFDQFRYVGRVIGKAERA